MAVIADNSVCKLANLADVIVCTRFHKDYAVGDNVPFSGIYRDMGTNTEAVYIKGDTFRTCELQLDVGSPTVWRLVVQAEPL